MSWGFKKYLPHFNTAVDEFKLDISKPFIRMSHLGMLHIKLYDCQMSYKHRKCYCEYYLRNIINQNHSNM